MYKVARQSRALKLLVAKKNPKTKVLKDDANIQSLYSFRKLDVDTKRPTNHDNVITVLYSSL